MFRKNLELENRIKEMNLYNAKYNVNLYGGMGMYAATDKEKMLRLEEIDYMKKYCETSRPRHYIG